MSCETCALVSRRDEGKAPLWDSFLRTSYFDLVHCNDTSLPGWLVLVHRKHIGAIDEMSDDAAVEMGRLIQQASIALKQVVGCEKTYVMQFAEAQGHPHVHFHLVPRMADIPAENKGPSVFNYLGVGETMRVPEKEMDEIARRIRTHIISNKEIDLQEE